MTTIDDLELEAPPLADANDMPGSADVDVASEAEARAIIERLVPDIAERMALLNVIGEAILTAHAAGSSKWALTLFRDRFWLNVGRVIVCGRHKGRSWLALDKEAFPDRERFERDGLLSGGYKSISHSASITFSAATDPATLATIKPAFDVLIQRAADAVRQLRSQVAHAHSSGALAYLRSELQCSLPDPDYVARLRDVDPATIEQAFQIFDAERRGNGLWANWEADRTFKYAVLWEGHRYPVKEIVRLATGVTKSFNPDQARDYLEKRGFSVVSLRDGASQNGEGVPAFNVRDLLHQQLTSRGLHFTPWQIATFYTALQAKGFVILSGISGTGKTKLAQHFAELLPQPAANEQAATRASITIALKPYMFKYNRLIIPKQAAHLFELPRPGETRNVKLTFADKSQVCKLTHSAYSDTDYIALMLRGTARTWFAESFAPGDTLALEPELDDDQELTGFRLSNAAAPPAAVQDEQTGANWLFIPVRPDWRDSKSLLGYYNPLTQVYVWTDFLRMLVRAAQSYRNGEHLAWFVILDEMNLARVEYYFADLLSVLESGRMADGWTREALRLDYPDDAEGDLPPRELKLPPNLYFVGTVNVDETTHAFSPKVLDRAFTIEFVEADFKAYPPLSPTAQGFLSIPARQEVLQRFSDGGQFGRVDKHVIAAYVQSHPEVRDYLQCLNEQLHSYNMHFGYRVFDEIVSFLAAAERNGMFAGQDSLRDAFDAAVLMKVLPKFHGSRGKLEAPLGAVLAWCVDPLAPDTTSMEAKLERCESGHAAMQVLNQQTYQYRRTAERVQRMIWSLYTDGFASFG